MRSSLLFPPLAAGAALVSGSAPPLDVPSRPATAVIDKAKSGAGDKATGFAVTRAPDSLFYVRAAIGSGSIDFAIDTGASVVVLAAADARRLGLDHDTQDVRAATAGGMATMRRIRIERLVVAGRTLRDVDAAIAGPGVSASLLGQSALSRFDAVTFGHDRVRFE